MRAVGARIAASQLDLQRRLDQSKGESGAVACLMTSGPISPWGSDPESEGVPEANVREEKESWAQKWRRGGLEEMTWSLRQNFSPPYPRSLGACRLILLLPPAEAFNHCQPSFQLRGIQESVLNLCPTR